MSNLERRRRVRCRLPCELLGERRQAGPRPNIVTLSEGGFAIETMRPFETGETIRICILPHRRERAVKITAIVWNDRSARRSGPLRVFGCVVSDPPRRFLDLLAEVEEREAPRTPERVLQKSLRARAGSARQARSSAPTTSEPLRRPARKPLVAPPSKPLRAPARESLRKSARELLDQSAPDAGLPRSREPLPPPKPEPEELLPRFRVRLKQVGGTRTRTVALTAPSAARAAERAEAALAKDGTRWQVLEVVRAAPDAKRGR